MSPDLSEQIEAGHNRTLPLGEGQQQIEFHRCQCHDAIALADRTSAGVNRDIAESEVAIVIMLSSLSAMTLAGPRVYFALERDGTFFPAVARVHPRYRTPAIAIVSQAVWSALLVLSGTFNQLLTYTGFAVVLSSGWLSCRSSLFTVGHKNPRRSELGGIRGGRRYSAERAWQSSSMR
jgi:hypothetical protein